MLSSEMEKIKNQARFRRLRRDIQDLVDQALEDEERE